MNKSLLMLLNACMLFLISMSASAEDARQIIKDAIDHFRGLTSYSEASMTGNDQWI